MDQKRRVLPMVRQEAGLEEQEAVEQVFRREYASLLRIALRYVRPDDARDVVQDAVAKLLRQRETRQLRGRARARAIAGETPDLQVATTHVHLLQAVRDQALDLRRRQQLESRVMQLISGATAAMRRAMNTGRPAADAELLEVIHWAVSRLPERLREPWILIQEHGLNVEDASTVLRLAPASCRAAVSKANALLRQRLQRMGVTPDSLRGRDDA